MLLSTKRSLLPSLPAIVSNQHRPHLRHASTADPYRWPSSKDPSPYEILEIQRHAPYSKQRYYELVKQYHPDLSHLHTQTAHHPQHVCLERFRLIVAAHSILSDKHRRYAYDTWGAGWNGHATHPRQPQPHQAYSRGDGEGKKQSWWQQREGHDYSRSYGHGGPDDASANATWEDWERWYAARNPNVSKQETVFADNSVFVAGILFLALVGSLAEVNYAKGQGAEVLEVSDRRTAELGRDVLRRRREALQSADRKERVRRFLIMRNQEDAKRFVGIPADRNVLPPPPPLNTPVKVTAEGRIER
jgi:curved DNA-binding protein CbpA